ncbi:phosphatase PAP2 family protein [Actinoplanes sp. NPDC048967]|uniref:phosphatase PAP2 family protein n=1 Tax=Actinoplanes sp. NPDC048967 TaxID=3155269 RepID=UPI0033E42E4B
MLDNVRLRPPKGLDRFAVRSIAGLLVLVSGSVGFLLVLVLVREQWTPLYRADQRVADSLNDWVAGNDLLLNVLRGLTDFGGHTILTRVLVLATAYLLIRRQFQLAAYVVITAVGALVLDPTLKLLVGRLRPVVDMPVAFAPGMSFPSGHALGSFVSYGVLLLVFLPAVRRRWRVPVITTAVFLVTAVGFTRIALGVHHISDVVAGWLLGGAWLAVTASAFHRWHGDSPTGVREVRAGLSPEAGDHLRPATHGQGNPAHPGRVATGLIVAWVMVLGMLYGAGLLVVRVLAGSALLAADEAVVRWFAQQRRPLLDPIATVGSKVGNTHWILAATLAAVVLIVALRRRLRPVIFLATVMLGEVTLFLVSSSAVNRPRPDVPTLGPEIPPTASFPSGHFAAPLCLYGALALLIWHWSQGWPRWVALACAVVVPAYVGAARLYWGVHHPLDLAGSLLLAAGWVAVCWWFMRPASEAVQRPAAVTPGAR